MKNNNNRLKKLLCAYYTADLLSILKPRELTFLRVCCIDTFKTENRLNID